MLWLAKKMFRFLFLGKEWEGWTEKGPLGSQDAFPPAFSEPSYIKGQMDAHEMEHRALVYLMTQKTDSVLSALAKTIEEERVKLGVVKRVNEGNASNCPVRSGETVQGQGARSVHDQVLSLAREGTAIPKIARHLVLPENEVSMVLRLHSMG